MTRKDFFKKLGIGAAACVVAPKILADIKPEEKAPSKTIKVELTGTLRGEDIHYVTHWNNPCPTFANTPPFNNIEELELNMIEAISRRLEEELLKGPSI